MKGTLLGKKIKLLRRSKDLSREEFASRIGVTPDTIFRWEHTEQCPSVARIETICRVFDVPWDYFNPAKRVEVVVT